MSKSKSPTEWLDELLIKHCPDLTDVQHIKLRQAILNQVEEVVNDVIDVCRQEYIADANTPHGDRLNSSQMTMNIQAKQFIKAKQLIRGKD